MNLTNPLFKQRERRFKWFAMSAQLFLNVALSPRVVSRAKVAEGGTATTEELVALEVSGLPDDAELVSCSDQHRVLYGELAFIVWSSTFPVVLDGNVMEQFEVTVKERRLPLPLTRGDVREWAGLRRFAALNQKQLLDGYDPKRTPQLGGTTGYWGPEMHIFEDRPDDEGRSRADRLVCRLAEAAEALDGKSLTPEESNRLDEAVWNLVKKLSGSVATGAIAGTVGGVVSAVAQGFPVFTAPPSEWDKWGSHPGHREEVDRIGRELAQSGSRQLKAASVAEPTAPDDRPAVHPFDKDERSKW